MKKFDNSEFQVSWSRFITEHSSNANNPFNNNMSAAELNTSIAQIHSNMDTASLEKHGVSQELMKKVAQSLASAAPSETKKTLRVRKEVSAECRCMARTWGSAKNGTLGLGPQCTAARSGGDYCKMHAKKAAETEQPCQWKDGKKFGLFMGRIDQPLTGKDQNGKWQILWLCPEVKEQIQADKEAGTFELGENELKHKSKSSGPKKPRAKKEKPAKKEKAVKAPRGKNAYMFYLESRRAAIVAEIKAAAEADGASEEAKAKLTAKGSVKVSEVTKIAGAEWKQLDESAKAPFVKQSADDKAAKLAAFEKAQGEASEVTVEAAAAPEVQSATPPAPPAKPTVTEKVIQNSMKVNSTPLSPSVDAEAQQLLASLQSQDDDEEEPIDVDGPWTYTLEGEHAALSSDEDAAAIKFGEKHYVVPMTWYEKTTGEEEDESEVEKVAIGMLTSPVYPRGDDEIKGTFTPKA